MSRLVIFACVLVLGLAIGILADHHLEEITSKWEGKPWLGKWESTGRKENLETFIKKLGYPSAELATKGKVTLKFWQEGDHYHHVIAVQEKNYKLDIQFQLGETGISTFNNVSFSYLYTEQGNDLRVEITVPVQNKTIIDTYRVINNGTEIEKIYQMGNVVAKRWYKKEAIKSTKRV